MAKKLTIEFIREQFEKEGYTLLSKEYIDSKQNLKYICPKGHRGTIRWSYWQQGNRCWECSGQKKHTIDFIRAEFEKEGYTLLSKEYINNRQNLEYICPKEHIGTIKWNYWQQGNRCFECSGQKKHTIDFIRAEFEKENYILLTEDYVNNKGILEYICPKGHKEKIRWNDWQQGHRCKQCHSENNKGSNNPRWNPNLTEKDRQKGRHIPNYVEWVYAVKERDNFTCQICGDNTGGNLVSHHLESYGNNPDLRTLLENGICL